MSKNRPVDDLRTEYFGFFIVLITLFYIGCSPPELKPTTNLSASHGIDIDTLSPEFLQGQYNLLDKFLEVQNPDGSNYTLLAPPNKRQLRFRAFNFQKTLPQSDSIFWLALIIHSNVKASTIWHLSLNFPKIVAYRNNERPVLFGNQDPNAQFYFPGVKIPFLPLDLFANDTILLKITPKNVFSLGQQIPNKIGGILLSPSGLLRYMVYKRWQDGIVLGILFTVFLYHLSFIYSIE
ncbi:MAG: hypothetical protein IPL46_18305 [Saprospiraceae bacterium]|nr:hypothetical protein [Saprospiraceae bacterium]